MPRLRMLAVIPAVVVLAFVGLAASPPGAIPRTADGKPDLQGTWSFATATPLERPADLVGRAELTDEEAAAYARRIVAERNRDTRATDRRADVADAYNDFWFDQGTSLLGKRASLVIDPPSGRLPPVTSDARARAAAQAEDRLSGGAARGPEDRNLAERCLVGLNVGPPMVPSAYNNNVQIFQTRATIALVNEMIHDTRIVPLDGRPAIGDRIRQWHGSSRGRWEGDTLVVATTNFRPEGGYRSSHPSSLVERFTRVSQETLLYEFTIDAPAIWTGPWTAQIPMVKMDSRIYEYACHEGNYAMANMLRGAREQDKRR